jgi:hypothetical protein
MEGESVVPSSFLNVGLVKDENASLERYKGLILLLVRSGR